jgi:type VI secretion system protein ImpA
MTMALQPAELEAILAPISGDQPTGVDLREDYAPTSIYFRLRDARAEARDAERQAESQGGDEGVVALWRPVVTLAIGALKETSKDLEVATWLTEAMVRISGLPGLTAGAAVIGGLVERYWDTVFPMPDEDGMETRVAAVAGLSGQGYDGTLMQPLRKATLFRRPDGSPFALWQYEGTLELSGISDPERRTQRIESGVVPFEDVEKEARMAGPAHWSAYRDTVTEALAAWTEMGAQLDEKAGDVSPSGNRVRDLLRLMLETTNRFAPPVEEGGGEEIAPTGEPGAAATPGAAAAAPGVIAGREQALRQLGEIASWFKRTEPNSPIAYTLDEAVRRGRMSWPELVEELIPDETTRHALLTSLGIKPPAASE